MTKSELAERLAFEARITKKAALDFVDAMFDFFVKSLKNGEKVIIKNFGNIRPKYYASYTGRNPKTNQLITVPEKVLPVFRPSNMLINYLNDFKD